MPPEACVSETAGAATGRVQTASPPGWNAWYVRLRRPIQLVVALSFFVLPWANAQGWVHIRGSLFAMNIYGLPFADPLSALQVLLLEGYFAPQLWAGAVLVVLTACAFGRFFCGWLCPYGLLSELVYGWRKRWALPHRKTAPMRHAFLLRLALCVVGLVGAFVFALPLVQRFSMPGELSLAPLRVVDGWSIGLALLFPPGLALLIEGLSGRRLWCRYACPQSVCLSLAAQCFPGGFGVTWAPARCTCRHDDRACQRACSLGLAPCHVNGPPRSECSQCGQCVSACAERGAALRIGL